MLQVVRFIKRKRLRVHWDNMSKGARAVMKQYEREHLSGHWGSMDEDTRETIKLSQRSLILELGGRGATTERERQLSLNCQRTSLRRRLFDEQIDSNEDGSSYWDFGTLHAKGGQCSAIHCMVERLKKSFWASSRLDYCFSNGMVQCLLLCPSPCYLRPLLV